jgi:hypothetical protein
VGISEFYVMLKAKLRFITVHNWNRAAHVRPGTGVLVGEGGEYVEYYANLAAVKTLQTSPWPGMPPRPTQPPYSQAWKTRR